MEVEPSTAFNLMEMGVPKTLVALVLLLGWCNDFPKVDPVNLFEIFSGAANTTKWWHKCGFKCASFDFTYGQAKSQGNPMDFNQPSGFLLCLYVIMQELPNALNLMAPDCGSWGIPARGTTRRAFHNYLGCSYPFVLSGNLMVARLILCCLVVLARRAIFIIENPHGSLIFRHHRFEYLTNLVAFVYRQAFWMGLLGGQTPKRLLAWSNDNLISALDLGKLCREKRESLTGKKTTRRYVDRNGRTRFVGNKAALKQSQEYPTGFGKRLLQAYTRSCDQPPRKDLRRKFALDIRKTDRELFQEYPCNPDQWFDAELPKTFWYLAGSRSLRIPDSWAEAIGDFKKELHQACVNHQNLDQSVEA